LHNYEGSKIYIHQSFFDLSRFVMQPLLPILLFLNAVDIFSDDTGQMADKSVATELCG